MIELRLPMPPSVNHYKNVGRLKTTKSGKMYQERINSPETIRFYYEVWHLWTKLRMANGLKAYEDVTVPLSVEIDLYPASAHKQDIDNRVKVIFDSLTRAAIIADDSQISRLVVERKHIIKQGQIIVRIKPL